MHKGKVGLQKEISKIFTGLQVPKRDALESDTHPAAPAPAKYIPPKTVASPASRPFTIPEPPAASVSNPPQHTVPAPKQAIYEPPAPAVIPPPAPDRRPKPEPLSRASRQSPLLKIWEQVKGKLLSSKPGANQNRQKIMIVAIPVLAVVLFVVLTQVLRKPAPKAGPTANKSASAAAFNGKIDWVMPPLYPENQRDPMKFGISFTQAQAQAQAQEQETAPRPVVKGIVYSEDNPCAVVGDRIVSAGDEVDGATVVKINPDSVEFAAGDKKWTQKVER